MAPLPRAMRLSTLIILVAFAGGACASAATPGPATTGQPSLAPLTGTPAPSVERPQKSPPERIPGSPSAAPVTGEVPDAVIEKARTMLAAAVGTAASDAAVVVSEAVTWPDGSLGCPRPGDKYEQVEVAGYRVVFDVNGTRYDYRATPAGNVIACEAGGPHTP